MTDITPKPMSAIRELEQLLHTSGLTIRIGLRQQGHIPTVERMLAEGRDWNEIGRAIGWHGPTAKEWYERGKAREQD